MPAQRFTILLCIFAVAFAILLCLLAGELRITIRLHGVAGMDCGRQIAGLRTAGNHRALHGL
ncbi:hypothetical protein [Phyllobacterium myrsinacearum]|uniref:hypothetical protein n=1 Tax=Phyllobacterium myrsinacearum TaxID=28101 RepID=UPI00102A9506|nr:hypothetical protein [Phyllobacterium myrsinacearum]